MSTQKWQVQNEGLSKRAIEILRLLSEGMSDREVAERLVMTTNTIKWYNRQIYSILGVGSRTQAVARAHELQLLDEDEPPVPSFNIVPRASRHNLPPETTRFIGRKHELEDTKRLLHSTRLLTLVGSPGTGKTRLALQIAWEMKESFREGVYFVSLAAIADPALITNVIASAVGLNEARGVPLIETLKSFLSERQMLLILDNFEHLLVAATQVSELLSTAPQLKVLATSREPLHLYGEQQYVVPPLTLPDIEQLDPQTLAHYESIALFIQRARAVRSDFYLNADNASDVAKICVRLEGLPLAIELAAARIKLLTPSTLLSRLTNRLDTLTGGAHDLPARQKTLRNTIDWSYNLLDEGEKTLFARLAVFQGGCSLDAIEAVCGENLSIDLFDGVSSLIDKSLIQQKESAGGEPRFVMLETIHEYAWERLRASEEVSLISNRHVEYFLQLAERAEPEFRQAGFAYWMEYLGAEEDNLRLALDWSLGGDDVESGLRLVVTLRDFWVMSGRFAQGRHWTERALSDCNAASPSLQVRILTAAGCILYLSPQRVMQKQFFEDAIALARKIDDQPNLAWALTFLGAAYVRHGEPHGDGLAAVEEALSIFRTLAHKTGMVQSLNIIGELLRMRGDDERAFAAYDECLRLANETGEVRREVMMFGNLGFLAMHREDIKEARPLFTQALIKSQELGHDKRLTISCVLLLAGAIAASGELERAVRLFGAADALFRPTGVGLSPGDQPEHERTLTLARTQLDAATFEACWDDGHTLSLDQAVAYALEP